VRKLDARLMTSEYNVHVGNIASLCKIYS